MTAIVRRVCPAMARWLRPTRHQRPTATWKNGAKRLCLCFVLLPLLAQASELSHTRWVEARVSTCPSAIYFGVKRYLFINPCHTSAADGVIERGNYAISGDRLALSNRLPAASRGIDGIPIDVVSLEIVGLTKERLLLRARDRILSFRRGSADALLEVGDTAVRYRGAGDRHL